jgi:hypothetical protein
MFPVRCGSHSIAVEDSRLLGCDAVAESLAPYDHSNVGTTGTVTLCHIPQHLNPQASSLSHPFLYQTFQRGPQGLDATPIITDQHTIPHES